MLHNSSEDSKKISLSLLDRLRLPEKTLPEWARDTTAELIHSVERDLQNLLNTRKLLISEEIMERYPELKKSLVNYGIPDLTTINIYSQQQKQEFTDAVQQAIEIYEPRLKDVSVELLESGSQVELIFRFRIKATLIIDPQPIPVSFDTPLFSDTRLFAVKAQ